MKILSIETSCDETAAAVVEDGIHILSDITSSSIRDHRKYGGIVPEIAARRQVEYIIPVITKATVNFHPKHLDAIAVTVGPGLVGSLLVGVETAKTLALVWEKPLVPVHHVIGHIYSPWLTNNSQKPEFPALVLTVSGGHTELILMKDHGVFEQLGSTRDDAAGEAFDKVARLLGLPYPGGPEIERIASQGDPQAYNLPRPMLNQANYDFSFSGLKTAVIGLFPHSNTANHRKALKAVSPKQAADIAASFQKAVVDSLTGKVLQAMRDLRVRSVLLTGGVSANKALREQLRLEVGKFPGVNFLCPPINLAMDNATYIATAAYFNYTRWAINPDRAELLTLTPKPNLPFGSQ